MSHSDAMKAQVAIDLLVASIILFLVFTIIFGLYVQRLDASTELQQRLSASRILEKLAWNTNLVLRGFNATGTNVFLPPTLSTGDNYSIRVLTRRIEAEWRNKTESRQILTTSITNASALIPGRNVSITQIDGAIIFG